MQTQTPTLTLKVHSFETMGALDGPGIRTVMFLAGCPMRCVYCHNPDMFLSSSGVDMKLEALVSFALRYKNFYGDDGGVTLSGGEPLLQSEGVTSLLLMLKDNGIHTALDTSGCVFAPDALLAADLIILDIKHSEPNGFFAVTGHKIDNTLKTLQFLKENGKRFWIRQVIAPNFTDSTEQVKKLKELCKGAEKIELLPYHSMGEKKWDAGAVPYPMKGAVPPSKELMEKLNNIIKGNGE